MDIANKVSKNNIMKIMIFVCAIWFLGASSANASKELFDSHSHFSAEDAVNFTPQEVMQIFDRNKVKYALISSTPNDGTEQLYQHAPDRIIPFLGLYQTFKDKNDWMHNAEVVFEVEEALKKGFYRGIGELHIFAKDRKSPVLKELVLIAKDRDLMLQVHGDPEIIDEIFLIAPDVTVLWAHLGTKPHPWILREALDKYSQNLYIDTSVRDKQLLRVGNLTPLWKKLFVDYQDNFMVAIDTFSVNRWKTYDAVVKDIHDWLDDLPPEVAQKIAYGNAYKLLVEAQ